MGSDDQQIVMFDSPEAAQRRTVEGWVSRDGFFFGDDERSARYTGCTHRPCENCGTPTPKMYTRCESCRVRRERERYEAMPEAEWDGKQMVYSETFDRYYASPEEAEEELEDSAEYLCLVLCEPTFVPMLDTDYFCDELPEDGEAPDELLAAIDAFNAATKGLILSWYPGKTRLSFPAEEEADRG